MTYFVPLMVVVTIIGGKIMSYLLYEKTEGADTVKQDKIGRNLLLL